ncbi:DUF420 domain-containing protein [Ferviditalea candida]|uniref:DUF420 domain-containing protein n=1 Tax=Ferviditalea candida TaxID=3108399 RepID=A0ABU5ZIH6_9BACL|nr:DUF420 domain-containing protein [Paenibacillaceae bacterium T2]
MAHLLPTISTFFIVISAVFIAIGWRLILRGKKQEHKKVMLWGAFFALVFFIIYLSKTVFIGNTTFGGPDHLKLIYFIFLLFHIVLATTAAVFGITTILLAFNEKFAKHRKFGRFTATIWFVTAVTGVTVYVLLYLMYPGGETKGLIDAIFTK